MAVAFPMDAQPQEPGGDRDLRLGLRISLLAHAVLAMGLLIRAAVAPPDSIPLPPTLRVDIVGLPDQLKSEAETLAPPSEEETSAQTSPPPSQAEPEDDSLVAPTPARPAPKAQSKAKAPEKTAAKAKAERDKKLKNALNRIKSLNKISDLEEPSPKSGVRIKGNRISRGTSLSGDARESSVLSYDDTVRVHLQQNWSLPVWLARQELKAKVMVRIDSRGRLVDWHFTQASGNPQFDEQVKRALRESEPYPRPPQNDAQRVALQGLRFAFPL
jgi:colicin import membrane protein